MESKSSGGARAPFENTALRDALAAWPETPDDESRTALHTALCEQPLILALTEPLPGGSSEAPLHWATGEAPDGRQALCVYPAPAAAAAAAPGGPWLGLDPMAALHVAIDADLSGLLLDPGGRGVHVPHDDLCDLLGVPERKRRAGRQLSLGGEPENAIRDALARMAEQPHSDACLSVKEPRTGKCVQFARTPDGAVLMDVPRAGLSRDEIERARILFDDLAGQTTAGNDADAEDAALQALFAGEGDPGRAAKAAVKVFTWVFGFGPGLELVIDP